MSAPGIVLCGATGRTGNAVAHELVVHADALQVRVLALVAPSVADTPTRPLPSGPPAFVTLEAALAATQEDDDRLVVDLTHAEPAFRHLELALMAGVPVVLGATGLDPRALTDVGERYDDAGLGLLQVPNFSIGAVLAMRLAVELAGWFPDAEVIELHHEGKRDAPSGTAVHTARRIAAARRASGLEGSVDPSPAGTGASRGESIEGVPVHALRLPGATAHQEVVFGAPGELVTIRHDAIDRSCYARGVALAARGVHHLRGLNTGLECVL
jgi:4-hydroxy-tetrahydrodipicolinate reductase